MSEAFAYLNTLLALKRAGRRLTYDEATLIDAYRDYIHGQLDEEQLCALVNRVRNNGR